MNDLSKGSQILGDIRASFLQVDDDSQTPGHAATAITVTTAHRLASSMAPPLVTTKKDSSSTETEVDYVVKSWEEPPLRQNQSDRQTPYVRLPGPLLTDEEDEEVIHEKEIRSKELINYLREKWGLESNKKSSLVDVNYRTVDMLMHQRPSNYWLLKRAREKIAEHTGFFSNVSKPYESLGVPEMDDDMLLFRNLPDTVKISSDEWVNVQLHREQEKEKLNAKLPHLPYLKSKRTIYNRGRIKHHAGGINYVERLISAGEEFQREIRGTMTFTRLLEKWFLTKEEETANRGSPFGQVKRTKVEPKEEMPDLSGATAGSNKIEHDDNGKVVAPIDEKAYQEFLNLEKMITAIYALVKSVINIKRKQLASQNRIPHSGVMELRSRSPHSYKKKKQPPVSILDKFNRNTAFYSALSRGVTGRHKINSTYPNEEEYEESESDFGFPSVQSSPIISKVGMSSISSGKVVVGLNRNTLRFHTSGRHVPNPFNPVTVGEIYPLSETSSAEELKIAVERVQKIFESPSYLDDRAYELRSPSLRKERPLAQGERNRRHQERFNAMFQRHCHTPEPIWHDVHIRDYEKLDLALEKNEGETEHQGKSGGSMFNPTTSVFMSHAGEVTDAEDLPTPKLPGPPSVEKLSSEEQSRLNLLTIVPEAAYNETLQSPIRKLYAAAGIKTRDKDLLRIMMDIKRPFRALEKSLRVNVTNEVEKFEWDTHKRYLAKIQATCTGPIYENSIGNMRYLAKLAAKREMDAIENATDEKDISEKRPAPWFRDLIEMCDRIGALRHQGCFSIVNKLVRYCDVNSNSKPHMLRRFCLLVISLPASELAAPHFQTAIVFLLDRLFGSPVELLQEWVQYRGLRPLIT